MCDVQPYFCCPSFLCTRLGLFCTYVPRHCTRVTSCFTRVVSCCTRVVSCCVVLNLCCLVLSKTELSLTRLFQCCFLNAEAKPMNIGRLNFYLQPNINVETSLGHQHWINQSLSMLFQRCFVNVQTTSINIRRLNFHFQPNVNVETTLMNVDDQRCFNVDVLVGISYQEHFLQSKYHWLLSNKCKALLKIKLQKQPSRGVLRKTCSENMQQIYRRATIGGF